MRRYHSFLSLEQAVPGWRLAWLWLEPPTARLGMLHSPPFSFLLVSPGLAS